MKAFKPYRGRWVMTERTLAASAGDVEVGDLIMITSGGITVGLATNAATAIVGIAAEDIDDIASTQTLRIQVPTSVESTMIGAVTDGAIAAGDTDGGRTCDLEDHAGADTDTDTHHTLLIVKGRVATADGATTAGEAEFKIAQLELQINSF